MDQPLTHRPPLKFQGMRITMPMPLTLVIEDVGWWQGNDGSERNEPFRNNLNRMHCLDDYKALAHLAQKLSVRIVLGMVLCEWDRTNFLKKTAHATWMGPKWNNEKNRGPWLDEAARFINSHARLFELALHGVGHEFWDKGKLSRSEFHDNQGRMRPRKVIEQHLDAFKELTAQNHFHPPVRIFIPPALNHSFGNQTFQALLKKIGIDYVVTRFSRARQSAPPNHPCLTWECGVALLEREEAPVPWHKVAAKPVWPENQIILPLHWANLLHEDPEQNFSIVDQWADFILEKTNRPDILLAGDMDDCFCQAGIYYLGRLYEKDNEIVIDRTRLPDLPCFNREFTLIVEGGKTPSWKCRNGTVTAVKNQNLQRLTIRPHKNAPALYLAPIQRQRKKHKMNFYDL